MVGELVRCVDGYLPLLSSAGMTDVNKACQVSEKSNEGYSATLQGTHTQHNETGKSLHDMVKPFLEV